MWNRTKLEPAVFLFFFKLFGIDDVQVSYYKKWKQYEWYLFLVKMWEKVNIFIYVFEHFSFKISFIMQLINSLWISGS